MNARGLIAALSLGGAIIGTRVLAGSTVVQPQPESLPLIGPAACPDASGAEPRQRQRKPAGTPARETSPAPNPTCLRKGKG
jgi:hypothetical protein